MCAAPPSTSGFAGAVGRLGRAASLTLQDRLELLALELREAKIRFVRALILACMVAVFMLLGLLLLVFLGLCVLPPDWMIPGLAIAAVASLLAATATCIALGRGLARKPLAFEQSLIELRKDAQCFSTRN